MTGTKTRISCALLTLVILLGCFIFPNPVESKAAAVETHYIYEDMTGLSKGQINIMKRARQMLEIKWTPMQDVTAWRNSATFKAGTTYTGIPYGQPVNNQGYVGYNISLDGFMNAVETAGSKMYTGVGSYNGAVSAYYANDCSAFASYCWGLKSRLTTWGLASEGVRVSSQTLEAMQVGDILNRKESHVIVVGGIIKNSAGKVMQVEIFEQTPNSAIRTVYKDKSLCTATEWRTTEYFYNTYFKGGYELRRHSNRDGVTYTHSCAVPIDGDYCANCKDPSPTAITEGVEGGKNITLTSSCGGSIFYTLDGSTPTAASKPYTGPIKVTGATTLKAIVLGGPQKQSRVLTYNITISKTATPGFKAANGFISGNEGIKGTTIALTCSSTGAKIYYTLDGTAPTTSSLLYSAPINLTDGLRIRAIAVAPGCTGSAEMNQVFKLNPTSYSDVPEGKWYLSAVEFVTARGLFSGVGDSQFSPNSSMNRAMFVTVLGRLAGLDKTYTGTIGIFTGNNVNVRTGPGTNYTILGQGFWYDTAQVISQTNGWYKVKFGSITGYVSGQYFKAYDGCFTDVPSNSYFNIYVQWAYLLGITNGTTSTTFSPGDNISRQDMCVLLSRFAERYKVTINAGSPAKFDDDGNISGYAKSAVYAMKNVGVVNGVGNNKFAPGAAATRAEVAQIFTNFCQKVYH